MVYETTLINLPEISTEIWLKYQDYKIWLLHGQMGSGKTTFLKTMLPLLGVNSPISSPTFSLINQYDTSITGPVYHMDLYRAKSIEELEQIGIFEYLDCGNYTFIEWPELLLPYLGHYAIPYLTIGLTSTGTDSRRLEIDRHN